MSNKIQLSTKTFVRFWLVILGFVAAALFLWKASFGLLLIGAAIFLAVAISPLVKTLANIISAKNSKIPTTLAYVIVVTALAGIFAVIVPAIASETIRFVGNLPHMIENVANNLGGIDEFGRSFGVDNLQGQSMNAINNFSQAFVSDFGANVLNSVGAVSSFFAAVILVVFLTFLMLLEGPAMLKSFWERLGKNNTKVIRLQKILHRMSEVIAKYVSGALLVSVINGGMTTLVVFILSMIFNISPGLALPFGLITGALSLIPMFGAFIGGVMVAVLLAFNSLSAGIVFLIYCVIYLQIEANFISPKVQSKGMRLPALVVLSAVTIGVYMFGLLGAIIAIPVAGCIRVLIEEYFLPEQK